MVLATVVALEGSSYRRPGVRMLINNQGEMCGAVSGGCVEKEIVLQAGSVFKTNIPKMMAYDGRYRLGCEGIIYILIEPFILTDLFFQAFDDALSKRIVFQSESFYSETLGENPELGTRFDFNGTFFSLNPTLNPKDKSCFHQSFSPVFQLYIFGAEHDAVTLCKAASGMGWEVHIIAAPDESKTLDYFPGAHQLNTPLYTEVDTRKMDDQTAIILMTHSFSKDVQYLMALSKVRPAYFGLLGPAKRRERLIDQFLEYQPDTTPEFLDQLNGPAGINIGAESAQEISISILAEILTVIRSQEPVRLREKKGRIHE
jgi:xanthine/CO dehydrogenase XdhC/CoxF family maturation factor